MPWTPTYDSAYKVILKKENQLIEERSIGKYLEYFHSQMAEGVLLKIHFRNKKKKGGKTKYFFIYKTLYQVHFLVNARSRIIENKF